MANATSSDGYCPNAYSERMLLNKEQAVFFKIAFISLAPVTIIPNGMLIYHIAKSKLYRNVSNFLILVMCVADFLTGAVTLPCVYTLYSTYVSTRFCLFELATQFISTALWYISIAMIMFIAIERLVHQTFKTSSGITISNRSARYLALSTVLVAITLCSMLTMSSTYNSIRIIILIISLFIIVIITIVFVSYVLTYLQVSKFVRNSVVLRGENTVQLRSTYQRVPIYLRQLGKTAFYIIICVVSCHLPAVILIFIAFFTYTSDDCVMSCSGDKQWMYLAFHVSYVLIYSNSSLNAFIILVRNRSIAKYEQNNRKANAVAPENAMRQRCAVTTARAFTAPSSKSKLPKQ